MTARAKHKALQTMRLLDTQTGQFVEKDQRKEHFTYAILSHVWDLEYREQTYKELKKIQEDYAGECLFPVEKGSMSLPLSALWDDPHLSHKVRDACVVARNDGYRYIWIDSCCIDKTSSAELSEAINSMYVWYAQADVCYVYLADVLPDEDPWKDGSSFRGSRWFKRGWTLQELIAPKNLRFLSKGLSKGWTVLGSKEEFAELVNAITRISVDALSQRKSLAMFSVAQRLSWAAGRETTRVEDRAYSLLGIFDINMSTLYGEGERAFQRLQEEILRRIPDQSIFAWGIVSLDPRILDIDNLRLALPTPPRREDGSRNFVIVSRPPGTPVSLLAPSPDDFVDGQNIEEVPLGQLHHYPDLPIPDYSFTPHGIRTHLPLIPLSAFLPNDANHYYTLDPSKWYVAVLGCAHVDRPGHLLGRVCHVDSSTSDLHILSHGVIRIFAPIPNQDRGPEELARAELVALSAEALARSSALATVDPPLYLSSSIHPSMASPEWNAIYRPHKAINLLLKHDTSGSRSSHPSHLAHSATTLRLQWPDQDHPNTHRLTISPPAAYDTPKDQDMIVIEYTHTLELDGRWLTIVAHVTNGMLQGRPIVPVDTPVTWTDEPPWNSHTIVCMTTKKNCKWKERETIMVRNGEGAEAQVELSLEFIGLNHYRIDAHTTWGNLQIPSLEQGSGVTSALGPRAGHDGSAKRSRAEFEEGSSRMSMDVEHEGRIRPAKRPRTRFQQG